MSPHPARHLGVSIACSYDCAWAFLSDPANWASWAEGLGSGLSALPQGDWAVRSVDGRQATVRFAPANPYGVLDHTVYPPSGEQVFVPLRLLPNGDGCEVVLTLLRPQAMSDAGWAADAEAVHKDLRSLKAVLEALA